MDLPVCAVGASSARPCVTSRHYLLQKRSLSTTHSLVPLGKGGVAVADGRQRSMLRAFALVSQLGLTVVAGGLLGGLGGYWLDRWLGTAPGFLTGGLLFGLAGGAVGAYRLIVQYLGE